MSALEPGATVEAVFDVVAARTPDIRAALRERRSVTASENPSGETQLEADVRADELLAEEIQKLDDVGAYASEEREAPVDCGDGLSVTVDPLDGSSNLVSNNLMGTVVGIYDADLPASGRDLVGAGFVLYGPITTVVTAADGTVAEYEVVDGDMDLLRETVTLPEEPTVYGFGGGVDDWEAPFAEYADEIRHELKLRYGGALVGDVAQVLRYGGVFAYPALRSRPEGKLRLQFEANPMAYVIEAAGGRSSDGAESLLDVTPTELHARTPVYLGNRELVDRLERALADGIDRDD